MHLWVKSKVGANFPFELLAGNHDAGGENTDGGLIDNFLACLPNRISTMVGTYGKEYYFDYPETAPIARFLLISPNTVFTNGGLYDYAQGTVHYNWVANTIDQARAAGIKWIVVGMHKTCISMGDYPCDHMDGTGPDLFNLLVNKKVDLILHGHWHSYQRSKQLALSASCPSITIDGYDSNCVSGDGANGVYTKDKGSAVVITGAGGISIYNVNVHDPEAGYFVTWMGKNANSTYGFTNVTISASQLSAQFVGARGGTFSDSFSIVSATPTPTPTPTATPTPTVTPTLIRHYTAHGHKLRFSAGHSEGVV